MIGEHGPQLEPELAADLARLLFSQASDALLLVEPLGERVLDANPMAQRLTGCSRDSLLGRPIRELIYHEQGTWDWRETVRLTGTFTGSHHFLLCAGRPEARVPIGLTITRLAPSAGAPLALVVLHDRREQGEPLERLQRMEAELRRVIASVPECLWNCRVDAGGRWRHLYLSPVVERITGRPVDAFLDNPAAWAEGVVPEDRQRWQEHLARINAGVSGEIEYRIRRADGLTVWLQERVTAAPLTLPSPPSEGGEGRVRGAGQGRGFILHGMVTDITRHKQSAPTRPPLSGQVQESLGVLAGGIAHDFNNLLAGILGSAELARGKCSMDSPIASLLDQIKAASLRAAELCQHMLAFAGKGRFVVELLDLNELLFRSSELLRGELASHTTLMFAPAPRLPAVPADASGLCQVVRNLVLNAAEAMGDQGGQIRITTSLVRLDRMALRAEKYAADLAGGDFVGLEVIDNGPGMTPDVRARIFEPFFTTRFIGRGLGLAAVWGIVRRHRGMIQVESEPGLGSTIRVLLPLGDVPQVPVHLPAAPVVATRNPVSLEKPGFSAPVDVGEEGREATKPVKGEGGTILLVDDDEAIRNALGFSLKAMGFRIVEAADGRDALEKLQQEEGAIRLVLLDVMMPRLDGEETLRELRRRQPNLPVIMMSGFMDTAKMDCWKDLRPTGFLSKPFNPTQLAGLLRQVFS